MDAIEEDPSPRFVAFDHRSDDWRAFDVAHDTMPWGVRQFFHSCQATNNWFVHRRMVYTFQQSEDPGILTVLRTCCRTGVFRSLRVVLPRATWFMDRTWTCMMCMM